MAQSTLTKFNKKTKAYNMNNMKKTIKYPRMHENTASS